MSKAIKIFFRMSNTVLERQLQKKFICLKFNFTTIFEMAVATVTLRNTLLVG